jgi:hypothetical protein
MKEEKVRKIVRKRYGDVAKKRARALTMEKRT